MSEPSSPASESAIVAIASTSLASHGGKRKATSGDLPPSPPSLPPPFDASEAQDIATRNDYPEDKVEEPVKKKVKKPLEKIVPVWKDLKQWKEGDDPLGRFPVEVLDLIISVDSDLDLLDHLALAGTCRYFRTCYRDVVFRVLFQAAFPHISDRTSEVEFGESGSVYPCSNSRDDNRPCQRSFNDGRRIFSSGRSLVGAGGWEGWGLTRHDFEESDRLVQQKQSLQNDLDDYWKKRPLKLTKYEEREIASEWVRAASRPKRKKEEQKQERTRSFMREDELDRRNQEYALQDALGLLPYHIGLKPNVYGWMTGPTYGLVRFSANRLYDPWPSSWRETVSRIVLAPSDAKEKYKLTDRELLGLKERDPPSYLNKATKYYSKAAVEALSLRSHGGVGGHEQHVAKLEARKLKARATRAKNDALLGRGNKASAKREEAARSNAALLERETPWFGAGEDTSP